MNQIRTNQDNTNGSSVEKRRALLEFWVFLAMAVVICGCLVGWIARINDPDSFYHIAHARLYWERGIFYRDFAWVAFSVISKYRSDLWWGFHVLLSPLGLIPDKYLALRIAPAVLLVLNLLVVRKALITVKLPGWYAFAFLFASTGFLMRCQTIRPQTLSCALLLLVFAALFVRDFRLALTTAVCIGLIHSTLFYMILPVGVLAAIGSRIRYGNWQIKQATVVFLITLFSGTIRPGWLEGIQLLKVQLFDLLMVRRQKLIHNFGMELDAASRQYLANNVLPFACVFGAAIFITLAVVINWRRKPGQPIIDGDENNLDVALCAGLMAFLAYGLMALVSKRGLDQVIPFGMLSVVAMIHSRLAPMILGGLAICINIGLTVFSYRLMSINSPKSGLEMKALSEYLRQNAKENEIVFNPVWSHFPELFFWNQRNRYINGMDPIFAYQFDTALYWKQTVTADGRKYGFTGPTDPSFKSPVLEEPLYVVLPRDFDTRWIALPRSFSSDFQKALRKDPVHYVIRFQNRTSVLFEIRQPGFDPPVGPSGGWKN